MRVNHLPCAPFVNVSEETAFTHLQRNLLGELGQERFVILTNVAHAVSGGGQANEIDMVVVGPTGVHVIEVKHWDRGFVRSNRWAVEEEADRAAQKARRIATKVRRKWPKVGFVAAKMLLTKEQKSLRPDTEEPIRGVRLYSLSDWRSLVSLDALGALPESSIDQLCEEIVPRSGAVLTGDLRRLGHIADMALLSAPEDRFHRIYRGRSTINQDRLVVHVYDLSASNHPNPEHLAQTEFRVVQRLQKSPWLPRLVDSFQDVPNYPGELFFFSVADSGAPTIRARASDPDWPLGKKFTFAKNCLIALSELHSPPGQDDPAVVHRTITPDAILVRATDQPLFFSWDWAKLPERITIAGPGAAQPPEAFTAPEVRAGGLAVADRRSDVYALCASLDLLFRGDHREEAQKAAHILVQGMAEDPEIRPSPESLADQLDHVSAATQANLPIDIEPSQAERLWVEDETVNVDGHSYRVIGKLGVGGMGETFKLQQFDLASGEEFGTYVAKVVPKRDVGTAALHSYELARPYTKHPNLAGIYSTAPEWRADAALAMLEWVEGTPLGDYAGVLELYVEDLGESDLEGFVLIWVSNLCDALGKLHEVGLIHGDVSPSNIIVNGSNAMLIDYDLVTRVGQVASGTGTPPFSAANLRDKSRVTPSDDLFALAATVFYVLTGRDPFLFDGIRNYDRGVAWTPDLRQAYPKLARFLDRAVSPEPSQRLPNAIAAATFLRELAGEAQVQERPLALTPNEVPWLKEILTAYPGSRYGNVETRGLDSDFSERTYVETELDELLCDEVRDGRVALVILCGNAGDGKTAFLQHLAARLGLPHFQSSQRVWEVALANGIKVKANLDGAAAWKGRSADELLDEIFAPFHQGRPPARIAHIVAVNDGRLMEWVEGFESRHGPTRLTEQIAETLSERADALDPHIRLVELNLRSLVGGIGSDGRISTRFLGNLFARLVGGVDAREVWRPCLTCSAQSRCTAWRSARLLGAGQDETERRQGALLLERLSDAFQVVHQRNEVHITTRELKAAASYILFGTRYCTDLHADPNQTRESPWDLAFDPASPLRQGELFRELTRLDPALEAHPRIDRYLLGRGGPEPEHGAPRYPNLTLKSARRRAYFEWTPAQIEAVGGASDALHLAGARHFPKFRDFPALPAEEQTQVCRDLCTGLSRLEDLPPAALKRLGVVPVRIVPRTPTETALWVERPFDRFALAPERFAAPPGLKTLHRHLVLNYRTGSGRVESLIVPFELFALLMDLKDGVQLVDTLSDDVFANVGVFTQRLAQEDERRLLAWNPVTEDVVYELAIQSSDSGQVIRLRSATL